MYKPLEGSRGLRKIIYRTKYIRNISSHQERLACPNKEKYLGAIWAHSDVHGWIRLDPLCRMLGPNGPIWTWFVKNSKSRQLGTSGFSFSKKGYWIMGVKLVLGPQVLTIFTISRNSKFRWTSSKDDVPIDRTVNNELKFHILKIHCLVVVW